MRADATTVAEYSTDAGLRARQRLWSFQQPQFALADWVLSLVSLPASALVADVGCGNGSYLGRLRDRRVCAVGLDLSRGMLTSTGHRPAVQADAVHLPLGDATVDIVLAAHMLYHVDDRAAAGREWRRVLRPGGTSLVVTNGQRSNASLRSLVESIVRPTTPGWEMRNPSTHDFSLDHDAAPLRASFDHVEVIRAPAPPARVTDAGVLADYVASSADRYQPEVGLPWAEVVEQVRARAAEVIGRDGVFVVPADVGVFVCR
jgi:SAM-dependent methyltransferase